MKVKWPIMAAMIFFAPYVLSNLFIFIFLIPLMYILYSREYRHVGRLIGIFSGAASLVLLPVLTYDVSAYLIGLFLITVFLGFFISICGYLLGRFPEGVLSVVTPSLVWVLLLYALDFRSLMSSAFDVGILFPLAAPLIWYAGSIGMTALLILFNSLIAHSVVKKSKLSFAAVTILSLIFISAYLFSGNYTKVQQNNGSRRVALIQGDVGNRGFFGYSDDLDDRISRYIELSRKASKERPDMILWPEYSLPVDVMNMFPDKMAPVIDQIKKSDTEYIIGSLLNDSVDARVKYNAALIFSGNGDLSDIYFSENPAIFNKGITPRSNSNGLFLGNVGILLCWEEVNERISRCYIKEGAEYLFALSSNAALDHSWFKDYISYFSRARAAENMRYLARVTQSGITQIIDPVGRVTAQLPPGKPGFITQTIYAVKRRTFYSVYGDILIKLFMLVFSIPVAIGLVRPVLWPAKTGCEE